MRQSLTNLRHGGYRSRCLVNRSLSGTEQGGRCAARLRLQRSRRPRGRFAGIGEARSVPACVVASTRMSGGRPIVLDASLSGLAAYAHEVVRPDRPQDRSGYRCRSTLTLVAEHLWLREPAALTSGREFASAGRQHIPYPLRLAAVCEGKDEALVMGEDVHRCPVPAPRIAADMRNDAEAGHVLRQRRGQTVREPLVEASDAACELRVPSEPEGVRELLPEGTIPGGG